MLFQMQKTRLKSEARHGIGEHLIDAAIEVGVETVGLLPVVVVLTDVVMNGKEQAHVRASKNAVADPCARPRSRRYPVG